MMVLVDIGLFVYGTMVIYSPGYVCDAMKSEGLYIWALVTYYLLLLTIFFTLCGLIFPETSDKLSHSANIFQDAGIFPDQPDANAEESTPMVQPNNIFSDDVEYQHRSESTGNGPAGRAGGNGIV